MTDKEEVLKLIKELPDDVSLEGIMRELYIYIKFQQGVRESEDEKVKKKKMIKMEPGKWFH
ncbi:hypothetical protein [Oceanobacillus halophilus]|uniref:DUF2281 domain-containing protein n=1 Tax=Oceanobacillus halophilus TaxID=930130 RepID=A0A495A2C7_9BACI|nr:hypothetical protein [Oceanobacillus halophilus]RKQ33457.1 hypothetical protein D8M06_09615 [Oceanobacillus halophilus]